jgi:hypothetical protein
MILIVAQNQVVQSTTSLSAADDDRQIPLSLAVISPPPPSNYFSKVGRSLVDGWQSQWRSAEKQGSFSGNSKCWQTAVSQSAKGDVCVTVKYAE